MDLKYILSFITLIGISILYDKYNKKNELYEDEQNYNTVEKFLLNDLSLGQNSGPILWIHMDYHVNSRDWKNFYSRNSTDMNQPYLFLTIKSIINNCGSDFNICLIDDNSFSKLLDNWIINLSEVGDPLRSKIRELALSKLLYKHGGLLVPPSFICFKSLIPFYNVLHNSNDMIVGEFIDKNVTSDNNMYCANSRLMGCLRESTRMNEYSRYLELMISNDYTDDSNFTGDSNIWIFNKIKNKELALIKGELLGVKDNDNKPVILDRLLSNTFIELNKNSFGLYIPHDEILRRTAYQWFARLNPTQVLETNNMIGKYLLTN